MVLLIAWAVVPSGAKFGDRQGVFVQLRDYADNASSGALLGALRGRCADYTDAIHAQWSDVIAFDEKGSRFRRECWPLSGGGGTFVLRGRTLELRWDKWGTDKMLPVPGTTNWRGPGLALGAPRPCKIGGRDDVVVALRDSVERSPAGSCFAAEHAGRAVRNRQTSTVAHRRRRVHHSAFHRRRAAHRRRAPGGQTERELSTGLATGSVVVVRAAHRRRAPAGQTERKLPTGLATGSAVVVSGIYCGQLTLELRTGHKHETMLHLQTRSASRNAVLNTRTAGGEWGAERWVQGCKARCDGQAGKPLFANGKRFTLRVQLTEHSFNITALSPRRFAVDLPFALASSAADMLLDGALATSVVLSGKLSNATITVLHSPPKRPLPRLAPIGLDDDDEAQQQLPPKVEPPMLLAIGVLSAPNKWRERQGVRRSWMQNGKIRDGSVVARFFVGMHKTAPGRERYAKAVNLAVEREAKRHGDMVIMEGLEENYYQIAHKSGAIISWGARIAAFVMKCDDDTYVKVDQILDKLLDLAGHKYLLFGKISKNSPVHRDHSFKWYMPKEDYAQDVYPPFPHGAGYVLSAPLAQFVKEGLVRKTDPLKLLRLEDVSVGIWVDQAKKSGLDVFYESGDFPLEGCTASGNIGHYIRPSSMRCMWANEQKGRSDVCGSCT